MCYAHLSARVDLSCHCILVPFILEYFIKIFWGIKQEIFNGSRILSSETMKCGWYVLDIYIYIYVW